MFAFGLAHEQKHVAWYLKEHLLKHRQIHAYVGDPPKKPTTKEKIKPLGS